MNVKDVLVKLRLTFDLSESVAVIRIIYRSRLQYSNVKMSRSLSLLHCGQRSATFSLSVLRPYDLFRILCLQVAEFLIALYRAVQNTFFGHQMFSYRVLPVSERSNLLVAEKPSAKCLYVTVICGGLY